MAERQPLVAVLAAGKGSRFGGGKLDADLAGKHMGRWALDVVETAGLSRGFIVTGPGKPQFARQAQGWEVIVNPHPELGLSASVNAALSKALEQDADLLLLLADMPLIEPGHLRSMVVTPASSATRYPDGRLGVPALIRYQDLDYFADLTGDRGAGQVLASLPNVTAVEAQPQTLLDIDDVAGMEAARRQLG
jgi:molybdenum cofactor cytidylyltransferase